MLRVLDDVCSTENSNSAISKISKKITSSFYFLEMGAADSNRCCSFILAIKQYKTFCSKIGQAHELSVDPVTGKAPTLEVELIHFVHSQRHLLVTQKLEKFRTGTKFVQSWHLEHIQKHCQAASYSLFGYGLELIDLRQQNRRFCQYILCSNIGNLFYINTSM